MSGEPEMFAAKVHATKDEARAAYDKLFASVSALVKASGFAGAVFAASAIHHEDSKKKVLLSVDGCGSQEFVDQIIAGVFGVERVQ